MRLVKILNGLIIKAYNRIISTHIINKNNKVCRRVRAMLFHNICYKCYAEFGTKNKDRFFYLIRCPQSEMGLFAVLNYVIYHINIADEKGLEPVVDWQYYPNKYFTDDDNIGKVNAWENYFCQTSNVCLEEVYKSKNVLMSSGSWEIPYREIFDENRLWHSHEIWAKYIKLNKVTEKFYNEECKRIDFEENRVLGVKCRGTDFVKTKPVGHTIVPDTDYTIKTIEEKMKEWGTYDKIYLSTEDETIMKRMQEYYGDKLLFTEGTRFTLTTSEWLCEVYDRNEQSKLTKEDDMRNYIVSTYILATCDSLIAPEVGGTIGAMRIRGKYEHVYIFQLGHY